MKDYLNQELHVGDEVVFISQGYRHFDTGIIIKIMEKKVKISFRQEKWKRETYVFPNVIIRTIH